MRRYLSIAAIGLLASCQDGPTAPVTLGGASFGLTTVTDVSTLDLGILESTLSAATGINDAGLIAGWSDIAAPDSPEEHAFLLDGASLTELVGLGGLRTLANAVNEVGQIVGITRPSASPYKAFLWDGAMTDLGSLGSGQTFARGLNDRVDVQVVGSSEVSAGVPHAFVWSASGGMIDIHDGSGRAQCSIAFDINNSGVAVGTNGSAWTWSVDEGLQILPSLTPGGYAVAFGINEAGQVVGVSETASGDQHAVLWDGGNAIDLGTLGHPHSIARDINEAGQVVGVSTDVPVRFCLDPVLVVLPISFQAFLWDDGAMIDLGAVRAGHNSEARSISETGRVVGSAGDLATVWTIETSPATPEEATEAIVADVGTLVSEGVVSEGRGNALLSQLDAITRQLNAGNTRVAVRLLESFMDQVSAMIASGQITDAEGQALIQLALDALALIGG